MHGGVGVGVGGSGRSRVRGGVLRRGIGGSGGCGGCGGMLDGIEIGVAAAAAAAVVDKLENGVEVMDGHCCGSRT